MSAPDTLHRWGRLANDLAEAGIIVTIDARSYPGGVSRSITIKAEYGKTVSIHDKWWRKNADVWIGWQVDLEGPDAITQWDSKITKKRSEVVAAVAEALRRAHSPRRAR